MALPCEFQFVMTREDWLAASRRWMESPEVLAWARAMRARQARSLLLWGPVAIAATTWFIGSRYDTRGLYFEAALAGAALVGVYALYSCRLGTYTRQAHLSYTRSIASADLGDHVGTLRVRLDANGISYATSTSEHAYQWAGIESVCDLGDYIGIVIHSNASICIPSRVFDDPGARQALVAEIVAAWEQGRMTESQRITRYLAGTDRPCPSCKYNLRGTSGGRCPECGTALSLAELANSSR